MDADDPRIKRPRTARAVDGQEWDVFVRTAVDEPMRHVGSVTANDPDAAHDQAAGLFGDDARDIWLCPATEIHRYVKRDGTVAAE